jgi:hypothetical protein
MTETTTTGGPVRDAKLVRGNENGVELRNGQASRKAQTWPGYHESAPLGRAGYWIGTHQSHEYVGRFMPHEAHLEPIKLWRDAEDAVGIESARAKPVRARICGGSA